ncbi:MAG: hypothetical protein Q9170_007456 [Blastenia crenularia]
MVGAGPFRSSGFVQEIISRPEDDLDREKETTNELRNAEARTRTYHRAKKEQRSPVMSHRNYHGLEDGSVFKLSTQNIAAVTGVAFHDNLEDLAFALSEADKVIVDFCLFYLEIGNNGSEVNSMSIPPVAVHRLQRYAQRLYDSQIELERCIGGHERFHKDYLSQETLLKFWDLHRSVQKANIESEPAISTISITDILAKQEDHSLQLLIEMAKYDANVAFTRDGIFNPQFQKLEAAFEPLTKQLKMAIKRKLLDDKQQTLIHDRYDVLEHIFRSESTRSHRLFPRKSFSWSTLAQDISLSGPTKHKKMDWISFMMWATAILSGIGSIPTFALGLKYSKPGPGTVEDADFWFLVQVCLMAFLGVVTLAIPLSQDHILYTSNKVAACGVIAAVIGCAVAAPLVYVYVSTAWAVFLTIVAGIFQAWLVVQVAVEAKGKREEKEGVHLKTE